jgi:hypothetical protein
MDILNYYRQQYDSPSFKVLSVYPGIWTDVLQFDDGTMMTVKKEYLNARG